MLNFILMGGGQIVRDIDPTFDCFGRINVGDYVYIGSGSKIMPGVNIGSHVLVAAGTIVTKSIPSDVVVAGNPARIICTKEEFYSRNKKYNLQSKGLNPNKKRDLLLTICEDRLIKKQYLKL